MSELNQFLIYASPDGAVNVDVVVRDETVWLTQRAMGDLFGVNVPAINKHLKNISDSGELEREATVSKMEIVRAEGLRGVARRVDCYNLDPIIAVGCRVNSFQAVTKHLRNIYSTGEFAKAAVCSILEHTAEDFKPVSRLLTKCSGPTWSLNGANA